MNEVDALRQEIADIADGLIGQLSQLQRTQLVQKAGWLALLRHLSVQGHANLETLQRDLEMLSDVQDDAAFQSEYSALAGDVQKLRGIGSSQPQ